MEVEVKEAGGAGGGEGSRGGGEGSRCGRAC